MLVDASLLALLFTTCAGSGASSEHRAFFQRAIQGRIGLFEGHASAAAKYALAGETGDIHLDIRSQQHHVGLFDGLGFEHIARPHRAAGFNLQVVILADRRLLQGFSRHEGVCDAGRTGGDGDKFGLAAGMRRIRFVGLLQLAGGVRGTAQEGFRVEQRLGWSGLGDALADEALQRQRPGFHHHHQIGIGDLCRRQRRTDGLGIVDFHGGRPAQTMGSRFEQA